MSNNVNKSRNRIKKYYSPLERRNFQFLLSKKGDYSNITLQFKGHDNSIKNMNTNDAFFKDINNKRLSINEIIENINALNHDFTTKEFTIL